MEAKRIPDNKEDKKAKKNVKKDSPKKAPTKKSAAAGDESIIARFQKFLRGAWAELKKVNWLNRKQIITFTIVVFISVAIVSAGIFVVDTFLSKVLSLILS